MFLVFFFFFFFEIPLGKEQGTQNEPVEDFATKKKKLIRQSHVVDLSYVHG